MTLLDAVGLGNLKPAGKVFAGGKDPSTGDPTKILGYLLPTSAKWMSPCCRLEINWLP